MEEDKIPMAQSLMNQALEAGVNLMLPVDLVIADDFSNDANRKVVASDGILDNWESLDIGPETISLFAAAITQAKTVLWNGPMGVFEMPNFAIGTQSIAKALVSATEHGATTIIGGGDSASAIKQAGLSDQVSHVSTGGGASLEYLEGKELPGLSHLSDK